MDPRFPELPIFGQPAPLPRRTQAEKYGAAFYVGIAGLAVVVTVIGLFTWHAYALRHVWTNVYVLNDAKASLDARIDAAKAVATDPEVSPQQRFDLCMSRVLPDSCRMILAQSLDESIVEPDPASYAYKVARSPGWPDWLRLLLIQPLAWGADRFDLPKDAIDELRKHNDPTIALWADYIAAVAHRRRDAIDALRFDTLWRNSPRDAPQRLVSKTRSVANDSRRSWAVAMSLIEAYESPRRSNARRQALDHATERSVEANPELGGIIWERPDMQRMMKAMGQPDDSPSDL